MLSNPRREQLDCVYQHEDADQEAADQLELEQAGSLHKWEADTTSTNDAEHGRRSQRNANGKAVTFTTDIEGRWSGIAAATPQLAQEIVEVLASNKALASDEFLASAK